MLNLITDHLDVWASAELPAKTGGIGRAASNGKSPHGIQKLRELILELAVRGKLVPQDANDEPASELLKKIAKEKVRLSKLGLIKNKKAPPEIQNEEEPFDLPEGWEWARFPSVCDYMPGKTPSTKNPVFWSDRGEGFPWISISDMEHFGLIRESAKHITQKASDQVFKHDPISAGSLLMSFKLTVGKIAILDVDAYHNEAIISIQPFTGISRDYLFKFLPTRALAGNTKRAIMGNTLNATSLSLLLIPVPPIAEQHRIVAKVDELMALCDQLEQEQTDNSNVHQILVETLLATLTQADSDGEFTAAWQRIAEHFDTLFTTEQSIDQLKQIILQLAVMGKLVPQDPNDELASELLKIIAAEKFRLIKEKKIKKQVPLPVISDDEKPYVLPASWAWIRVWDVAELITSGSRDWAKYYSDDGAIFVTMGNLSRDSYKLRLDSIRYVMPPLDGEGARTKLEADDLLISITGDVGNLGLIPNDFGDAYINQHTCLLRFITCCRTKYFPELMRSTLAKKQFNAPQRGVKNSFRLGDVGEMIIPLPPLAEQDRIAAKVDELMAICDELKARLNETKITQVQLADAIVEQAVA